MGINKVSEFGRSPHCIEETSTPSPTSYAIKSAGVICGAMLGAAAAFYANKPASPYKIAAGAAIGALVPAIALVAHHLITPRIRPQVISSEIDDVPSDSEEIPSTPIENVAATSQALPPVLLDEHNTPDALLTVRTLLEQPISEEEYAQALNTFRAKQDTVASGFKLCLGEEGNSKDLFIDNPTGAFLQSLVLFSDQEIIDEWDALLNIMRSCYQRMPEDEPSRAYLEKIAIFAHHRATHHVQNAHFKNNGALWECIGWTEGKNGGKKWIFRAKDLYNLNPRKNSENRKGLQSPKYRVKDKIKSIYPAVEPNPEKLRKLFKIPPKIAIILYQTLELYTEQPGYLGGSFITVPDQKEILGAWQNLKETYPHLNLHDLAVGFSHGIATFTEFTQLHLDYDLFVSDGPECIHDAIYHNLTRLTMILTAAFEDYEARDGAASSSETPPSKYISLRDTYRQVIVDKLHIINTAKIAGENPVLCNLLEYCVGVRLDVAATLKFVENLTEYVNKWIYTEGTYLTEILKSASWIPDISKNSGVNYNESTADATAEEAVAFWKEISETTTM